MKLLVSTGFSILSSTACMHTARLANRVNVEFDLLLVGYLDSQPWGQKPLPEKEIEGQLAGLVLSHRTNRYHAA